MSAGIVSWADEELNNRQQFHSSHVDTSSLFKAGDVGNMVKGEDASPPSHIHTVASASEQLVLFVFQPRCLREAWPHIQIATLCPLATPLSLPLRTFPLFCKAFPLKSSCEKGFLSPEDKESSFNVGLKKDRRWKSFSERRHQPCGKEI